MLSRGKTAKTEGSLEGNFCTCTCTCIFAAGVGGWVDKNELIFQSHVPAA